MLTKVDNPTCRSAASWRIARPSAPLCDDRPTCPLGGKIGENDAFSRTAGVALSNPMQFGPTMRMPYPRTLSTSCRCSSRPRSSASANPAVMTTSDETPAAAQSSATPSTASRGTATTARSTPGGRSRTEAYVFRPPTSRACSLTG